ncbi:hypothetical protein [Saccharolobus solfataricus]|uniref:hypothetical protein n=1 Tax=Saccharolobus solfataricus TaxID=2287 RepID=UPI001300D036|nr:hypothetical protein [Saccharolobus solfataricus]
MRRVEVSLRVGVLWRKLGEYPYPMLLMRIRVVNNSVYWVLMDLITVFVVLD